MAFLEEAHRLRRTAAARDDLTRAQLEAAWAGVRQTLLGHLAELQRQIAAAEAAGVTVNAGWLAQQARYQILLAQVQHRVDAFAGHAAQVTVQAQQQQAQAGLMDSQRLLGATVPPGVAWSFEQVPAAAMEAFVGRAGDGSPLGTLFDGFGPQASRAVRQTLTSGLALGQAPGVMARQVARDLDEPYARALTISRTESLRAYNDAALATYRANSDVCEGWIWLAELGPNTCAACLAMNGTEHDLDEELDDHPNGRCTKVPKTKGWGDILQAAGVDTSGLDLGELADTSADVPSGSSWFDAASEQTQRAVLGPGKYALYDAGDVSLGDLVGIENDPIWGRSIYERPLKAVGR